MTPPVLTKQYGYSHWKYNLSIGDAFTSLENEKQGLTVFLPSTGREKQAVRTISVANLSSVNGVKFIIEELDKLYLKDKSSLVYETYKKSETFSRPH